MEKNSKVGFYSEPMSDYHDDWEILSKSSLDLILKSPRHFWAKYISDCSLQKRATRSQDIGTHAHAIILENERFHNEYLCGPAGRNRNHVPFKNMVKENPGKIVLPESDFNTLKAIYESVYSQAIGKILLNFEGEPEVSAYWYDPHLLQSLKCRPDKYLSKHRIVIDIKTTKNIGSKSKWERHAHSLNYNLSSALTKRGLKEITGDDFTYVFLVIEIEPPFSVAAFSFNKESDDYSNSEIDRAISIYKKCLETNSWPGLTPQVTEVSVPKYILGANIND